MNEDAAGNGRKALVRLVRFAVGRGHLAAKADAGTGEVELIRNDGAARRFPAALLRRSVAEGLLDRHLRGVRATDAAAAFLRRALADVEDEAFQAQHRDERAAVAEIDGVRAAVRVNQAESPLGAIARLKDRQGGTFLPAEAIEAGERLLADFNRAQLQPRLTASWEPRLSARGKGERGGIGDLTDSAVGARQRVSRAVQAMGPELAGVALDVCCFMKGLELVERERQWPARSAKLMLRTALLALDRHYRPPPPQKQPIGHWGAEGFRPDL